MNGAVELLVGEFTRSLDDRFRLSLPPELAEPLAAQGTDCILAKERAGCLSLWNGAVWQGRLDTEVELIKSKIKAGRLENRLGEVQLLGRLLSTRHRPVQLAGRSRLVLPEGFREFLGVEPGSEVVLVGAALAVEIWRPTAWFEYVAEQMPRFREVLDGLAS